MSFSTRTSLATGFIAFAALLSACDVAPSEPFDTPVRADDRSSQTATTTSAPRPHSSGPVVPVEEYTSTGHEADHTEVIRYIESEVRLVQYGNVFDSVTSAVLKQMQSGEIPNMFKEIPIPSPCDEEGDNEGYPGYGDPSPCSGHSASYTDKVLMTSLPLVTADYQASGENPSPKTGSYPLVSITLSLVNGKLDFSAPLEIDATLLDGTKLTVKRVDDASKIPFSGDVTIAGVNTDVGTENGSKTDVDGTLKTVPNVKIMDTSMYGDNLTVDTVKMADRIILKKLQEVGELNGSDWY